jgi:hypothetical protein
MITLLLLLAVSVGIELLLTVPSCWPLRRPLALAGLVIVAFTAAGVLKLAPGPLSALITLIATYRAVNLARVLEDRMHQQFARHAVRQTAFWLGAAQLATAGLLLWNGERPSLSAVILPLALLQCAAAAVFFISLRRQLRTTTVAGDPIGQHDADVPGLTVAIAARNEDTQLEDCLTSLLASDYPKLEIIVVDDCSHDRTPDIIRSFAHAGVRFVGGHEPDGDWLARNLAYEQLFQESSGSLIMFCGVDVRVGRSTLRRLVATLLQRDKSMLSVLPRNVHDGRLPLVQAMRYVWEMALPRRLFNRPPVLSSCWLITRESLRRAGGFGAVRRSVTPEAHFARAATQHDGYAFVRSDPVLSLTSEKPLASQLDTAIQTRYPQLHRRPEMVLLVALGELLLCLAPVGVAAYGLSTQAWLAVILATAALTLQCLGFSKLQSSVFLHAGRGAALLFVPAIIRDLYILHLSMYRFEFSEVMWRGRNICFPVMRRDSAGKG